jgi:BASS family bile acid:Na+ symporter
MLLPLRHALGFIGRYAVPAYALSVILGLALPQLAAMLRPMIPFAIFVFVVLSFARANLPGLRLVASRPGRLGLALFLSTIVPPLVSAAVLIAFPGLDPAIRLALALMAAAPPLMASPVFTAILGFENSLSLCLLVLGMIIAPLTSPFLASLLAGAEVPISPFDLAWKLAIFIGGGMLIGLTLRRFAGIERLTAIRNELDGISVVLFFLFAIAAMDGVIDATLREPLTVLAILAASCALSGLSFAVAYALGRGFDFNERFSLALSVGFRNMGLLIAPILWIVPQKTFLYFALAQIPIYFAPMMLRAIKPLVEPKRPDSAP